MGEVRKQRNYVNKLKKKSVNAYFQERCVDGAKPDNFWKTIKPYLLKKNISSESQIILYESSNLITDQKEVSEIFNTFLLNVADEI